MKKCVYTKKSSDPYGDDWETACGKKIRYDAPEEVGMSFAPLPIAVGEYCSHCGGKIVLDDSTYKDERKRSEEERAKKIKNTMHRQYDKVLLLQNLKKSVSADEAVLLDSIMDDVDMFEAAAIREGRKPLFKE
jgi:hypothetical protein